MKLILLSACLLAPLGACGDDGGATTASGGGGSSSGGSTSGLPGGDGQACGLQQCLDDAACCDGAYDPSGGTDGWTQYTCPRAEYPANMECAGNECVQQNGGCSTDADCQICSEVDPTQCVLPDYRCMDVGPYNTCVEECTVDHDCRNALDPDPDNHMSCDGIEDGSSRTYCVVY